MLTHYCSPSSLPLSLPPFHLRSLVADMQAALDDPSLTDLFPLRPKLLYIPSPLCMFRSSSPAIPLLLDRLLLICSLAYYPYPSLESTLSFWSTRLSGSPLVSLPHFSSAFFFPSSSLLQSIHCHCCLISLFPQAPLTRPPFLISLVQAPF